MISGSLVTVIKKILKIARKENLDIAFMGGMAVSAWGNPRATYDINCLLGVASGEFEKFMAAMKKEGFQCDEKNIMRAIGGLSFVTLVYPGKKQGGIHVDVFLAGQGFATSVLSRKKKIKIWDSEIPLISPEDLILYKLIARREKDLEDVQDVLVAQRNALNICYLRKWAEKLGVAVFLNDELRSSRRENSES